MGSCPSSSVRTMSDRLLIQDLAVEARIGVFEWEQEKPQTIWIDLELVVDAARAAATDDVAAAIDYVKLVDAAKEVAQQGSYRLLETLADRMAAMILQAFETPCVRVRIKKRAVEGIDYAAVEVERTAVRARRGRAAGRRRVARASVRR